jgi:hypothetical protein
MSGGEGGWGVGGAGEGGGGELSAKVRVCQGKRES